MSWDELPPSFHRLARDVCTPRQLQVLILRSNDFTLEEIGQSLRIRRQTVHQHLTVAHNKIRVQILRRNGSIPDTQKDSETRIITRLVSEDT